ncbi:MAG: DUF4349 domain-containing protein [Oscillospiraceae bacterium]|jgi:hypothetical protein|nr:DUF4349 domain-containing protein [Oscillospiraceae bacterium]
MNASKKKLFIGVGGGALLLLALIVTFTSIFGGSRSRDNVTPPLYDSAQNYSDYENVSPDLNYGGISSANMMQAPPPGESPTNVAAVAGATVERQIIARAQVDMQTKEWDAQMNEMRAKLKALGGFFEDNNIQNYKDARHGNFVARLPSDKLEDFLVSLEKHATVTSKNVSYTDVSAQLIDTESKKLAMEAERDALLGLLSKAKTLDEIMNVQSKITEVRGNLESYIGQIQSLKNQAQYSTVTMELSEVTEIAEVKKPKPPKFTSEAGRRFMESLTNVRDGFASLALWFIAAAPYLVVLAVPVGIVVVIVVRKKKKAQAAQ